MNSKKAVKRLRFYGIGTASRRLPQKLFLGLPPLVFLGGFFFEPRLNFLPWPRHPFPDTQQGKRAGLFSKTPQKLSQIFSPEARTVLAEGLPPSSLKTPLPLQDFLSLNPSSQDSTFSYAGKIMFTANLRFTQCQKDSKILPSCPFFFLLSSKFPGAKFLTWGKISL